MASLCSPHGYSIRWTDNLLEHLQTDPDHKRIEFYEHLFCLKHHLDSKPLMTSSSSPKPSSKKPSTLSGCFSGRRMRKITMTK
jgi:hypothetical protein